MSWRTVIISSRCKLDLKMDSMVIRGEETKRIFLDEIAILLIENPAVSMTGCLLEALIEKKIRVIFCDSKHSPIAELNPYYGSHDTSRKIKVQTSWDDSVKGMDFTRSFFSDEVITQFMETVLSHEFKVLMLESSAKDVLKREKRLTIDRDLCEF